MQPHQERVVAESNELRERLNKLTLFISGTGNDTFRALGSDDQDLLKEQHVIMSQYLDVLRRRIARFA